MLTGAALLLSAGTLGVVPAASADDSPSDNNLIGPISKKCVVADNRVNFKIWLRWQPKSTLYSVDRLTWNTHGFTPAKLTVTSRNDDGSDIDLIRAWGGTTSTLHDVDATGDTGHDWETATHRAKTHDQVRVRVYLNSDRSCWVDIKPSTYW